MKNEDVSHNGVMDALKEQFKPVLENSHDGVYLWLDEKHMVCNDRLAKMFGYTVKEVETKAPFLENFVDEDDRELFSMNYQRTVAKLSAPTTFRFHGKRKSGTVFPAETDMIPISFQGHAIAYHFVREIKE